MSDISVSPKKIVINRVGDLISNLQRDKTFKPLKPVLLMLDYDGTLVPFAARPEQAVPSQEVLEVLECLLKHNHFKVAVISGRSLVQLDRLLPLPGLILSALHGSVIKYPGDKAEMLIEAVEEWLARKEIKELRDYLQSDGLPKGFWLESKGLTLAVHFRGVPDNRVNDGIDKVTKRVKPHLAKGILELMAGDRVLEIRPRGVNKGKVVRNIVTGHPGYYPIYIGDDFTDEDAFKEIRGEGITVRVSEHTRETAAGYQLGKPEEVLNFLRDLIKLLDGSLPLNGERTGAGMENPDVVR